MQDKPSITRILEISIPVIVTFAVSWGIYTAKSNAQEQRLSELETKYESVLELKGDIKVMKNDIDYIKIAVEKISDKN